MPNRLTKFLAKPVQVTMKMVVMLTLAMVVVAMTTAFNLKAQQSAAHSRCVEVQQRAKATAPALAGLVRAHQLDHDPNAVKVWQQYLDAARKNPVPKC